MPQERAGRMGRALETGRRTGKNSPLVPVTVVMMVVGAGPRDLDRTGLLTLVLNFELDRHMGDAEPSHLVPDPLQHSRVGGELRDDSMAAHGDEATGHRPDVQVV